MLVDGLFGLLSPCPGGQVFAVKQNLYQRGIASICGVCIE